MKNLYIILMKTINYSEMRFNDTILAATVLR
jgi:hypothetical protein